MKTETAVIFDTETTGITAPIEVIELAFTRPFTFNIEGKKTPQTFVHRFKPTRDIELGAMAAHGIIAEDLDDCPTWLGEWNAPPTDYLIGHSVDYDWQCVGSPNIPRICTLALARYLWPTLGSHTLSSLMFHLFLPRQAQAFVKQAHSAQHDVIMTWAILVRMLQIYNVRALDSDDPESPFIQSWGDAYALSEIARVPTVMSFGKHKGELLSRVPRDYKLWLLKQEIDDYLRKALLK